MYQTWAYVTNMSCDTEETMVEVTQEFIIQYFRRGSAIHTPTFLLYVWTLLWEKEDEACWIHWCRQGLFAVTVAASAICLSLYQCPQLLHSVHHFSFLFLNKCTLKNKIGRKYYIRLRYTTQRFSICSYFEMVTTLSQHPTLNVDTESFFLIRWSFKIYSFPSGVK